MPEIDAGTKKTVGKKVLSDLLVLVVFEYRQLNKGY